MEIDSGLYNRLNGSQQRDALELLAKIQKEKSDGQKESLIIDVGCGSGNVTSLLADTISHDQLVTFDIDPGMVAFAKNQIKDESIQPFVDDIGRSWSELSSNLTSFQGQASLVWSNRVLHWVPESQRPNAAQNIFKLLAPGGRFYANITYMANINEFLPAAQREENEKFIKVPGEAEQVENWQKVFEEAGLTSVSMEKFPKEWTYEDDQAFDVERDGAHYFRRYLSTHLSIEEKDAILKKLGIPDLWVRTLYSPLDTPPTELKDLEGAKIYYYLQFRFSGVKPLK